MLQTCHIILFFLFMINKVQCFHLPPKIIAQTAAKATPTKTAKTTTTSLSSSTTNNDFFGENRDSFMLQEFSAYEDLIEIIKLSSMPLPERPDDNNKIHFLHVIHEPSCTAYQAVITSTYPLGGWFPPSSPPRLS